MDPRSGSGEHPPEVELTLGTLLDVFIPGELKGRVRITARCPLIGELRRDATGAYSLAPEEEYRGGGMQAIPVHDLSAQARTRFLDRVVALTGVFEDGKGVTVATIALAP